MIVEELVKNDHYALVVTHDFDIDADTDVYTINSEEKLLYFKQQLLGLCKNIAQTGKKLVKNNEN